MQTFRESESRFGAFVESLALALGHADRIAPMKAYCTGLILPGDRKSVEPMAARVDSGRVRAAHQSLHHFVAKADWSDTAVLDVVSRLEHFASIGEDMRLREDFVASDLSFCSLDLVLLQRFHGGGIVAVEFEAELVCAAGVSRLSWQCRVGRADKRSTSVRLAMTS